MKNTKQKFFYSMTISLSRTSVISRLQNPAINIRPWPSSYLSYLGYLSVDYCHSCFLKILSSFGFLEHSLCLSYFSSCPLLIFSDLYNSTCWRRPGFNLVSVPSPLHPFSLFSFMTFKSQMYILSVGLSPRPQPTWRILPACLISHLKLTHPSKTSDFSHSFPHFRK